MKDVIWLKEIAPSTQLRKWFDHRAERWPQFCVRYAAELDGNPAAVAELRALCAGGPVTLLYSARDVELDAGENHRPAAVELVVGAFAQLIVGDRQPA